jgi:hypothetical protein
VAGALPRRQAAIIDFLSQPLIANARELFNWAAMNE